MSLHPLLPLQALYALCGFAFNAHSFCRVVRGRTALTSTPPAMGMGVMAAYALALMPGIYGPLWAYRCLMALALIVLGYGGVLKHLRQRRRMVLSDQSISAWRLALSINLYGLLVNFLSFIM